MHCNTLQCVHTVVDLTSPVYSTFPLLPWKKNLQRVETLGMMEDGGGEGKELPCDAGECISQTILLLVSLSLEVLMNQVQMLSAGGRYT